MKTARQRSRGQHPATPPVDGTARVFALDARRIENALAQRTRYKYVQPRVQREGGGWKVVSPNCSRNIDPQGGEIDIAWLVPTRHTPGQEGCWLLFSRDHLQHCWQLRGCDRLPALLAQLSADPRREFWQ